MNNLMLLAEIKGSYWFAPAGSTFAKETDALFMYIGYISLFFFVLVVGAMIIFAYKYRRRPGYQGDSTALHSTALEITWTVIPTLIVCWMFVRGVDGYIDQMTPPTETIDINVKAMKWSWSFTYPNGAESNELHVPINKPVRLLMRSEDVLHAFYVPAFRAKQDIVPGRVTVLWFEAILKTDPTDNTDELKVGDKVRVKKTVGTDKVVQGKVLELDRAANKVVIEFGTKTEQAKLEELEVLQPFPLYCTEYCGDDHSKMRADVYVHSAEDYEKKLVELNKNPVELVKHGQWLYERRGCKGCHSLEEGKVLIGPSFSGSWGKDVKDSVSGATVKFDEQYILESIEAPQAKMRAEFVKAAQMPSYKGRFKSKELMALNAFFKALEDGTISPDEENALPPPEPAPTPTGDGAAKTN
jgi:cytochrome c oxidase subunit II